MCVILCTYTSHSEVTQLCAECQGSCRQACGSTAGFLASGPSPVCTMKMQSPSSTSESLRSCASLPCSDERLVYLQGPSVPGKQSRRKGPGGGAGDRDGPEGSEQKAAVSPSSFPPFPDLFSRSIYPIPTCSYILCLPRILCFWSSRSAELGSRSTHELCDFRQDALSLRTHSFLTFRVRENIFYPVGF